jgi:uncharacterized protein (DUF362 family)/NAD-dependent dihydropyrimidine dehydrogenase PreA subunit
MAKVSIARCESYDTARVAEAVRKSVDLTGGIGSFVKPGMKVLLKPNMLSPHTPDEAVTTHPEVIRAVGRLVKEAGGIVWLGDAPGGYGYNIDEILEKTGIGDVAAEEGIEIKKFTVSRMVDGVPLSRHVLEADLVISIPKLKTHSITVITAAVKNMFGSVVGLYKAECHSRAPKEEDFAKIMTKVFSLARPRLTVVDGIVGMEGDGPSAGRARKLNLIMAGTDAVAIDACVSKVTGIKPFDVLVTKHAHEAGLGEADLARIETAGDNIEDFIVKDFKLPQTTPLRFMPKGVMNSVASLIRFRPHIDMLKCKRCNLCKVACPVECITIEKFKCAIDYDKCIRCLCCHEVCPYRAISIKRNVLTRMIWG